MANPHGSFIWYERISRDVGAALAFYGKVVGWESHVSKDAGFPYHHLRAPDRKDIGGMIEMADGPPPGWLGYIGVDDVDRTVDEVKAAGGAVHVPPTDIPNVGRFALLSDPQGVPFYVMRGDHEEASEAFSQDVAHCAWNELSTGDPDAALDFYSRHFGWEKGDAMPMGEMGDYQFIDHGGRMIGAVMRNPPGGPPPMWRFYFGVPDIDAAAANVTGGGGTIHHGPEQIPGGDYIIIGGDPEGAIFGLVGPRKS
jgi:uncharacterized protein